MRLEKQFYDNQLRGLEQKVDEKQAQMRSEIQGYSKQINKLLTKSDPEVQKLRDHNERSLTNLESKLIYHTDEKDSVLKRDILKQMEIMIEKRWKNWLVAEMTPLQN